MKRILIVVLLTFVLCFTAQAVFADGLAWPTENLDLVSIKMRDTDDVICLGMARADVESILGEPLESEPSFQLFPYVGGIEIAYRDDAVCGMRLRPEDFETCSYDLGNGIAFGSSMKEVVEKYEPYLKRIGSFWECVAENVDGAWTLIDIENFTGGPKNLNDVDNINRYVFIDFVPGDEGVESVHYYEACFAKFLQ